MGFLDKSFLLSFLNSLGWGFSVWVSVGMHCHPKMLQAPGCGGMRGGSVGPRL